MCLSVCLPLLFMLSFLYSLSRMLFISICVLQCIRPEVTRFAGDNCGNRLFYLCKHQIYISHLLVFHFSNMKLSPPEAVDMSKRLFMSQVGLLSGPGQVSLFALSCVRLGSATLRFLMTWESDASDSFGSRTAH